MKTTIPRRISSQYHDGVHGFRKQKRREIKVLKKGIDQLRQGCFFYPCGANPIYALEKEAKILTDSLSVKNWGK